jgi:uncharacterized RDD family membrane protein YckC
VSGPPLNPEPAAGVVTPEAVLLEFDTAGVGSRSAAEVIDLLVLLAILTAVGTAVGAAAQFSGGTIAVIIGIVMELVVLVGYPVAMEALWNGRTLGKAAFGLRVVTVEGGPIRFRHAMIRGVLGLIEIYATLGTLAVLSIILSKRDQRLGDLTAGTLVLRERTASGHLAVAVTFPPPYGLEGYVATLDVSTLSGEQYGLVRSFLMRVVDLSYDARNALAVKLANAVAFELRLTPPANLAPEPFLACVAAAYQRRYGGPPPPQPPPPPPGFGGHPSQGFPPGPGTGPR